MNEFYKNITDALIMLDGFEKDLNIRHFTPNELKVFHTIIIQSNSNNESSTISGISNVCEAIELCFKELFSFS